MSSKQVRIHENVKTRNSAKSDIPFHLLQLFFMKSTKVSHCNQQSTVSRQEEQGSKVEASTAWQGHVLCSAVRSLLSEFSCLIIECEGWRRHSSLIFLILLFTKPNIKVSGWLYQTKTHFTHIIYQPFSRASPPSFTLYDLIYILLQ